MLALTHVIIFEMRKVVVDTGKIPNIRYIIQNRAGRVEIIRAFRYS